MYVHVCVSAWLVMCGCYVSGCVHGCLCVCRHVFSCISGLCWSMAAGLFVCGVGVCVCVCEGLMCVCMCVRV